MLREREFDVRLAKKVVAGEIEGKLTCNTYPVVIYDWNFSDDGEENELIVGKIIYNEGERKNKVVLWNYDGTSVDYGHNYELTLEVQMLENEILKEDFKELHREIVQKIINFCQSHHIEPHGMNMTISDLASSVDEGVWVPATDSTFELYNHIEDPDQRYHKSICFSA